MVKIILDENQQLLTNFASEQVLDANIKQSKKIDSTDTLSSTSWKHCNKNENGVPCMEADEPNLMLEGARDREGAKVTKSQTYDGLRDSVWFDSFSFTQNLFLLLR